MKVGYLIVGGGLAGSLLANELLDQNKSVRLINDPTLKSSSSVAGGMVNPVTGKYLTKTWLDDKLFPYLFPYYRKLQSEFGITCIHETGIFRPFSNEENKAHFFKQIEKNELQDYVSVIEDSEKVAPFYVAPLGGLLINSSGWVDVPKLLAGIENKLKSKEAYLSEKFEFEDLIISDEKIRYKNIEADRIIFCEGFYVKDNPYFNWLPFNPVKGETLLATLPNYTVPYIVNQGKWVMPIAENTIRIGATYSWHELDFISTERARADILAQVSKFLKSEIEIKSQAAGVRPSTKDRRPIMGPHPKHKNVLIFNGLGTKGVSLAPYLIKTFLEFLFLEKDIQSETTIERYYALYS